MMTEIGGPLFKFAHFPLFESWNDVWLTKDLVNWHKEGLTIDRFLKKYAEYQEIKYSFWESENKQMTDMSINLPTLYADNKLYLDDILSARTVLSFR